MKTEDIILMMVLLSALVCAGFGSTITSGKNRGPILGLMLGLVLGPIGVLVAALLPNGPQPAPSGMVAIRCARCNTVQNVSASAAKCECWKCKLEMNVKL